MMAAAVLAHVLTTTSRASRRQLAVLRAVGLSRGQAVLIVAYEATVFAFVAVAVGLPAGVAVGRLAWRLYAQSLGVVPESVTPWPTLGTVAVIVMTGALMIAFTAARRAALARPALVLRSE
jgi:ABC-type antimicrobial peptide transport system permease subunit